MDLSSDPEITYRLSDVTATAVILSKFLIHHRSGNLDTFVSIFKMVNLLFGLKIKHFYGLVSGSTNNIFVIKCYSHRGYRT